MTYKALLDIGGFKKGDVVPDDKAKVWLAMFAVPHVALEKLEQSVIAATSNQQPDAVVQKQKKQK